MILERTEIEASITYLPIGTVLVQDIAAAFASIFCMLGSARGAWKLFVLDGAQVPEQQGVPARCQVVAAKVCEFHDVHFRLVLVQGLDDRVLRHVDLCWRRTDQIVGLADVENLDEGVV